MSKFKSIKITRKDKVEEDIVFNEKSNISSLILNVQTEYTAVVNENGSVSFINENGESEFTVGVPYLYDGKDNICSNISVSAEITENGYIIKYDLNKNWLDDESRSYPVIFDPSITTKEYNSNIIDTYVYEGTTNDHSAEARIYVGIRSGNKYRTYIKINNLPDIDPNCPILSATLTLKIYATTTTGKAVSLYKVNSSWNTATLTYANQPSASPLSTCAFDASNLYYNLNITSDFPYLYDEYNSVSNYGYMVRYTDESNTNPDWNSIYSMEYTSNTSYRPIFTVVYGYSLPDELVSGGIYSFQNVGSMSLMTVHNGTNANDTNVYQLSSNGPQNATVSQKFKLEEVSSTGGYYLRAMCSSNGAGKVLDIYKTNGFVENGNNVQIYTANDPLAQHWLLVPVDSVFFKIIPRTNMSLALTAYGNNDGTANGKTSTSAGNIFVSEYTGSDYQKWFIYDCVNNIGISAGTGSVSNNTYYFNNSYTGKYLHKNTNYSANSSSGLVSNLGNTIRWKVTYHSDNLYTIQSSSNLSLYLNHTTSNTVSLLDCSGYSNIPNTCLWRINTNAISYVSSSNSSTYYLSNSGTTLSLVSSRGSSGSDSYKKTTWRFCTVDYYSGRELNSNFSISDMVLDVGESKAPTINKSPSNTLWANVSDFSYSIVSANPGGSITVNSSNSKISGIYEGNATVRATHKPTGRFYDFCISISAVEIVIPIVYGYNPGSGFYPNDIHNFPTYLQPLLEDYSALISGCSWYFYDNGIASFDDANFTVLGYGTGIAWLEARTNNNKVVLRCYIYVEDILKDFPSSIKDYLQRDGFFLGTMSCLQYDQDHKIDPLYQRVEWYLYAISLLERYTNGVIVDDDSIKYHLYTDIGLDLRNDEFTYRSFMSEVELGSLGGFDRNTFKLSFDGLRFLLNFYLFQFAKFELINLDTVNVYTPATAIDFGNESTYAKNLCNSSFDTIQDIKSDMIHNPTSQTTIIGTDYNGVSWYNTGEAIGAKYYYASESLYNYYNSTFPFETYAANKGFLLDSLFCGDTIYCSHNPIDTLLNYPNTTFAKEIRIIQDFYNTYGNGVSFVQRIINGITVWECVVN